MSKKHPPRLSEDDLAIWRRVAGTANPIKPEARALSTEQTPLQTQSTIEMPSRDAPPRTPDPLRIAPFSLGEAVRYDHSKGHDILPTLEARLAAQPLRMDRKTFQRMKRGKLSPERTLDLHGMTLAQAHPALIRFILRAHGERLRLVAVVTGKGKLRDDDGPIPTPRGVLRHHVPGWLQAPPLGGVVLQLTDAHQSHGGGGAYYVYLRRNG
ncbi:Smr/MutS family protein [Tropicimonas sp. IMCC34043]|uniref:Smr/MutS family protein n=1 Tax=Tropicimonas sp. IMCC34043 TaxID=2248760 RepID=UPI000E268E29|nr:Smr/MutS family protein [Tropicimonas sp. IMCC34043]